MIETTAIQTIDQLSEELSDLSRQVWEHPEVAYQETFSSRLLADYLESAGFTVERGYAGLPTAFRASYGQGHPVIGLLGEYDALPGMSQTVADHKEAVSVGAAGHACQHNLLGVAHLAAALGIKAELEATGQSGTVVFYGCPAEEALTGKVFMARNGAFRDLDLSLAWHPGTHNAVSLGRISAVNTAKFHFKGVSAHAGGDPENGRSALDGVELMNVGANYMREHVTSDVRIHYTITNGGQAPNIVPDKASVWYYVRALSREAVEDTYRRLVKIAQGAAMMTETDVEVEYLGGCYNTLQNKVLAELVHETMSNVKLPQWSEEELDFAQTLNDGVSNKSMMGGEAGSAISQSVLPISSIDVYASTDVGDVMHIAPGVLFTTASSNSNAAGHSWHNTACAGMSIGQKGMLHAGKVMAAAAMKIYADPAIADAAKAEFDEVMAGKPYVCPIGPEVPVPGTDQPKA